MAPLSLTPTPRPKAPQRRKCTKTLRLSPQRRRGQRSSSRRPTLQRLRLMLLCPTMPLRLLTTTTLMARLISTMMMTALLTLPLAMGSLPKRSQLPQRPAATKISSSRLSKQPPPPRKCSLRTRPPPLPTTTMTL